MHFITATLTLRINCDDHLTLYLDGVQQEGPNLKIWNQESTFETSADLGIIAAKCHNTGGPGGLVGSLEDERGDVIFDTNTGWKCSAVLEDGWEQPEFQDTSSNWQNAKKVADHDGSQPWTNMVVGQISRDAEWIWSKTLSTTVYCRGKVDFEGKFRFFTFPKISHSIHRFTYHYIASIAQKNYTITLIMPYLPLY